MPDVGWCEPGHHEQPKRGQHERQPRWYGRREHGDPKPHQQDQGCRDDNRFARPGIPYVKNGQERSGKHRHKHGVVTRNADVSVAERECDADRAECRYRRPLPLIDGGDDQSAMTVEATIVLTAHGRAAAIRRMSGCMMALVTKGRRSMESANRIGARASRPAVVAYEASCPGSAGRSHAGSRAMAMARPHAAAPARRRISGRPTRFTVGTLVEGVSFPGHSYNGIL